MTVKPMVRGGVCLTAHPKGCEAQVKNDIAWTKSQPKINTPKRAVVLGGSGGFGLATRMALAFSGGASTLNVSFEREPSGKKPGSPGHYCNITFDREAEKEGLYAKTIMGDAFSKEMKENVIEAIKKDFDGGQIDLLVYSIASPMRVDHEGNSFRSVLKPLESPYTARSVDFITGKMSETTIEPATEEEAFATAKVMGGEDWSLWVSMLKEAGVLAEGFNTVAYSYIGPEVTFPIYRSGTIGKAKEHIESAANGIKESLASLNGDAYVSVNKALVTRASSVIPVVPLYISLLFKVMKEKGTHEGCREQMYRMLADKIYKNGPVRDENGLVRLDDWEMAEDVQKAVTSEWENVTEENLESITDIEGYRKDFLQLHGFEIEGVDYNEELETLDL